MAFVNIVYIIVSKLHLAKDVVESSFVNIISLKTIYVNRNESEYTLPESAQS
jgi:hypothetical protein